MRLNPVAERSELASCASFLSVPSHESPLARQRPMFFANHLLCVDAGMTLSKEQAYEFDKVDLMPSSSSASLALASINSTVMFVLSLPAAATALRCTRTRQYQQMVRSSASERESQS